MIGSQQTTAASMEKVAPFIATGKAAAIMKAVFDTAVEYFPREADALKAVCAGWAEIVIFNAVAAHVVFAVTEALHIKALRVDVGPLLPTRELFPLSGAVKLPKFIHMFLWWLLHAKITLPAALKRVIAEWNAANGCKLSKQWKADNGWDRMYRCNTPHIFGFSPTSFAPDWDSQGFDYSITGDW